MTAFRWKNCFADVQASKHDVTIQSYFHDVILPALATLDRRIDELGRAGFPGHEFARADMQDVLRETKLAFGLSIQSIWERQLRAYLLGCARELRPGQPVTKKETANWEALCALFREMRGIGLDAFPSFPELDLLQHLGNACRHGDGKSATQLAYRSPDLWRAIPQMPAKFNLPPLGPPPVAMMDIPVERLRQFVGAIAEFWRDATYIYNESLEGEHPGLEARLVRERAERRWLPQARAEGDA